ncbi:MAG TPA: DEAD/DEAH box helicase [Flavobacterium sp.]|jgi:replicative superfamily II helicase
MNIAVKYHHLEAAYPDLLKGISTLIQRVKIANRFSDESLSDLQIAVLEKAKNLCELRIIDLWEKQSTEEFKAMCSSYFDIATQLEIKNEGEYTVFEYIKIISFGYLGESWHLVRQYLKSQQDHIDQIPQNNNWNSRLLNTSFKALVGLIRKKDWHDISHSIELIESLRNEQMQFEDHFLNNFDEASRPFIASELVSLYHFAKAVEILAKYLIEGKPIEPEGQITYHIGYSKEFAIKAENISLQLLFQFFEAFSLKLIRNTIWYNTRGINSRISRFNDFISKKEDQGIFELLYPQKEALGEIFNPAYNAVVVNLPTSSGKTMIAEYRLLMALNQFAADGGWVAYVVPTRALVNQVYNQLHRDLSQINIRVEKVSGALELDGFEEALMERDATNSAFDVLVTTYEKLHLMIRQKYGTSENRPLVLAVVDEAHNLEEESRGLNLELLLSTIKTDCIRANFLLMTPDVINSHEIARWLGGDRGKELHLSLNWWQPNERVIGALTKEGGRRVYDFKLKTLLTNKGTYLIDDDIALAASTPTDPSFSTLNTKKTFASTLASKIICIREPSVILANNPSDAFDIANEICRKNNYEFAEDEDVELVRKFIHDELGDGFSLSECLKNRIGVHSSAIPDEIKYLVEDLMSKGKLQALVATTTIAQGINFPISSVIMTSLTYPYKKMPVRDFWNLAGRVGRAGQESLGWVGIISNSDEDLISISNYVKTAADELKSQLIDIVQKALSDPSIEFERWLFRDVRWSGLLQYISHLYVQSDNLGTFISSLELKLQDTFGYNKLNSEQKNYLKTNLRQYAERISTRDAILSDSTGFSTVSIGKLWSGLREANLSSTDWKKNQLFSQNNHSLQKIIGIMLQTPEIRRTIEQLSNNDNSVDRNSISKMMIDWVNGSSINYIAERYFLHESDPRKRIEKCTRAMYSHLANAATWGLAAIQKMPNSGTDWGNLSDVEKKKMANLPALLHYGVNTDEGVLMRKNNIPRSIAKKVGDLYKISVQGDIFGHSTTQVNTWLSSLDNGTWDNVRPKSSKMSGQDYKRVWEKLNGLK